MSPQNLWKEKGTGQLKLNVRREDGEGARLGMCNSSPTRCETFEINPSHSHAKRSGVYRFVKCTTIQRHEVYLGAGPEVLALQCA